MAYDGQQWMCLKPAAAGCCAVGYAAAKASKCFQAPQADNLYYKFVKTRVRCVSPCVSMAICAAAGTAAVAKCVAPAGATHEQVDVAAARQPRRRVHAPQARQKKQNKNKIFTIYLKFCTLTFCYLRRVTCLAPHTSLQQPYRLLQVSRASPYLPTYLPTPVP